MGQIGVGLASERSSAKDEFIGTDAKRPPVNMIGVSTLAEDLWSHVRHRTGDTCEEAPVGVMHCDVEVGQVGIATLI
jgi:hypothetical protein